MPDFSPDGRRIVFTSNRDQQGEIYVINANGSGQKRLKRRPGDDWAPNYSPDGTKIAFHQLPGTIRTMNADGTDLRKLTSGPTPTGAPSGTGRLRLPAGGAGLRRSVPPKAGR